ncbi:hypothetical protein [Staphylococcus epidermidis]|uniref:hypothetical protein n=1 Tax=Staphylococcus epidermidis TaxID=1282 RepID=UPI001F3E06A7|nr:hypothetical protein [Staphylococcus epidermidis]MCE4983967.1 hypothetical protein [Staphylococcus epidermidis]
MNKGIGTIKMSQKKLTELSNVELVMHHQYLEEKFKSTNKMKLNCLLPIDNESSQKLAIPNEIQKKFKSIFRKVMKDKIAEAHAEFIKCDSGIFETNVKEVLDKGLNTSLYNSNIE